MIKTSGSARGGPQSVGRILTILDSLASLRSGATLSELAEQTGAPKTSLVGLLAGMVEEGCLVRDEAGRYLLGPRFLSLAMRALAGRELTEIARPVLVNLAEASDETAVLGALAPDASMAVYLDKVESPNPIRYAVTVGERREMHCTAIGKVLLAWLGSDELASFLKSETLNAYSLRTIVDKKALKKELVAIRKAGVAFTRDELVMGASGIAAPILDNDGNIAAVLLVAGPTDRFQPKLKSHEQLVRQAAEECTRLIGGQSAQEK
jgi:IclR family transcriptional regulator, acetate operon repressor